LAELDVNGDGKLTGVELEGLEIWVDDGDAKVEEGEMQSLAQHGITEISVEMNEVVDANGDTLMRSTATTEDGRTIMTEDVWFASIEADLAEEVMIAEAEAQIAPELIADYAA